MSFAQRIARAVFDEWNSRGVAMRDETAAIIAAHIAPLEAENERLKRVGDSRVCSACLEQHPVGTMCPPHEMRVTGNEWFRQQVARLGNELAASKAECERLRKSCIGQNAALHNAGNDMEDMTGTIRRLQSRLAEIDAGAQADEDDLNKMRDGTKLTRAGVVQIVVYQQQDIRELKADNAALRQQVEGLRKDIADRQASFDLRWKADMRAIKRWQEAHPGNDMKWPDHADMVVWLLEQVSQPATEV